ncbi:MAG: electron transport complex subunit RsxD [Thiotrichales bacterium]
MHFNTVSSPHFAAAQQVGGVMRQVLYALVPGTAAAVWFFGWGVLVNVILAIAFALALESAMLRARARPVRPALNDYSAVVTAWLLALALPPLAPWWLVLMGMFWAIVVAKHLYGGLGYNPFNPAMVGYVALLISMPVYMTRWLPPGLLAQHPLDLLQTLQVVFSGNLPASLTWDMVTMATPLDTVKTQVGLHQTISEIRASPLFGDFSGKGWEWVANFYALGGLWLIYKRVIPWQIPLAVLLGLGLPAGVFYLSNPDYFASPAFHIFSGGAMLGAFFIATDPVSGSATPLGRILFGVGVGLLAFVIRTWGGYPDGIAFAVLLMNMTVPLLDQYTQPRVFGRER